MQEAGWLVSQWIPLIAHWKDPGQLYNCLDLYPVNATQLALCCLSIADPGNPHLRTSQEVCRAPLNSRHRNVSKGQSPDSRAM